MSEWVSGGFTPCLQLRPSSRREKKIAGRMDERKEGKKGRLRDRKAGI